MAQDRGYRPLEAILVRLVGIHRGFIAHRYRRGCPAVGHQCLHNKIALYRRVRLWGSSADLRLAAAWISRPFSRWCICPMRAGLYEGISENGIVASFLGV